MSLKGFKVENSVIKYDYNSLDNLPQILLKSEIESTMARAQKAVTDSQIALNEVRDLKDEADSAAASALADKQAAEEAAATAIDTLNNSLAEIESAKNAATDEVNDVYQDRMDDINNRANQIVEIKTTAEQIAQNALSRVEDCESEIAQNEASSLVRYTELVNAKIDEVSLSEDRKFLILKANGSIITELGPFAAEGGGGSGGGGGGSENNAVMTLTNASGWIAKSIAAETDCNITCQWSSIEDNTPTGEGTATVYVNGISRQTLGVQQGQFTVRVGSLLVSGKNFVRITVSDIYGNTRMINYTVTVVDATISSKFNTTIPFDGQIPFIYTPKGDLVKIVHFILDENELETQEVTTSGKQITYNIPAQAYGNHSLEVYFIGDMDGVEIESNHLYFEFACVDSQHNQPIITSNFNTTQAEQYNILSIPYRVYTPSSLMTQITLKVNGQVLNTISVDRTEQTWSYKLDNYGTIILRIEANVEVYKEFIIQVAESGANIAAETENLVLYLTSNDRNNGETNPAIWSYNDIVSTFTNFNFVSDGWQLDKENNTVLHLAGDARLTIPYQIFARDFKVTGKTIEIEFATSQVADYDTIILSCFADNIGLKITPQSIIFRGAQTELSTLYKENEHVRLSIVVGKQNNYRLILIYINGIMSRAVQYASGERFSQLNAANITIGSNDCDLDLYNIRIYDNDLTRQQILGNWIADTQNGELRLARYNHNNVYDEYGEILTSTLPNDLPYMILECDELPQYKGNNKIGSVIYTDPQNSAKSFIANNVKLNVQGTSSSVYFRKNYDLQFKEGFIINGENQQNYALRTGSIPFNRFVIKADVASSESTNNTGLTMFYNDTCPYKTPEMRENPKVRWGIEGIPIVVYWHNTKTDKFEFLGKHNFNLPKRAPAPYGYGNSDTLESWEWERNNSDNVKFKDNDFTTLSWDEIEQEYYPEWYNDFEARFPSDEWRDYTKLNELISWVKSTYRDAAPGTDLPNPVTYKLNSTITVSNYSDDTSYTVIDEMNNGIKTGYSIFTFTKDTPAYRLTKFKAQFNDYFEQDSAIFYYLFTELFTMIDSRAKNMFIGFNGEPINISGRAMDRKATIQPYDMDTAVGTNNSGVLMFGYYHEDGDTVSSIISGGDNGGSQAPVYNAQDSVLWSNVRDSFRAEMVAMYRNLRSSGAWSYQVVESMYENHQAKWPEAIFNEDAYIKYLYPLVEAVTEDENTGDLIRTDRYLTMLQGSKEEQRKWWLYNRFRYMDSKFNTGAASSSTLDIRLFNSGTLTITPVNDMYVGVAFGLGSTPIMKRVLANESAIYEYNQASGVTEMETSIFSGDMITDLGDLSVFYPNECNFAKGVKLKHLKIGSAEVGYSNTNLKVLDVSNSPLLETIDCRNCPELAITINLENSPRLQEAYFDGTSITGIDLADGGVIETLHLPATITTLTLMNLNKLTDLTIGSYSNISRLMLTNIDSSIINPITILNAIQPNSQVNIQGLSLRMSSASEIESFLDLLDTMLGVTREKDVNGEWLYYEQDTAIVSGIITTESLTGAQIASYNARYPYLEVKADHTTSILTYKTWNGEFIKSVNCTDGVPQEASPSGPVRTSTAQYDYTFVGWNKSQDAQVNDDSAIEDVFADRDVYAAYSRTTRTYTVYWKNSNGTTLETDNGVSWGTTPTYNGSTPVDPSGQGAPFVTWSPAVGPINGETTYTASFKPIWTVKFYNQAGTTVLQTKQVVDGNNVTYTGATPTNTDATTFLGWATAKDANVANAVLTNIKENKNFYAAHEGLVENIEITDTWDQIIASIEDDTYSTKYKIGNYKPLDLGTDGIVNMQIAAFDSDENSNGNKIPITFISKELLPSEYSLWQTSQLSTFDWSISDARTKFNTTIFNKIPDNIKLHIETAKKTYATAGAKNPTQGNGYRITQICYDKLWVPSGREMNFQECVEDSGVIYNILFQKVENRQKTYQNQGQRWATRTSYWMNYDRHYLGILSNGQLIPTSDGIGGQNPHLCIGFCLGLEQETITDSWQTILSNPNYATDYNIGDTKEIDFGAEGKHLMQIVAFNEDGSKITWLTKNLLKNTHRMTAYGGNDGGWPATELRQWLKDNILLNINSNIRNHIVEVNKTYVDKNQTTYSVMDNIWVPSYREMFGNKNNSPNYESSGIDYTSFFIDNNSRIKRRFTTSYQSSFYWLRSAVFGNWGEFYLIHSNGASAQIGMNQTNHLYGVCVGFCTN